MQFSLQSIEKVNSLNTVIKMACVLGFSLAYYSYIVETNLEQDPTYQPMCDISEHMSCTKAFHSQYGKGFGVIGRIFGEESFLNQPNSVPGMIFYFIVFLISLSNGRTMTKLVVYCAIASNIMSCYLGYILYFILKDFCVVCVSTYVANAVLLVSSYMKMSELFDSKKVKKSS